jgi:hypothetical protein
MTEHIHSGRDVSHHPQSKQVLQHNSSQKSGSQSPKRNGKEISNHIAAMQHVPNMQPKLHQQQIATQATAMLLKKNLEFSQEQLNELNRAGRFGKNPVPADFAIIP